MANENEERTTKAKQSSRMASHATGIKQNGGGGGLLQKRIWKDKKKKEAAEAKKKKQNK
jgi:hypothetical protein